MEKYIVDEYAFQMKPYQDLEYNTKIYTQNGIIKSKQTPLEIIKGSCMAYYSNYEGRRQATMHKTKYKYKVPIILCKIKGIYAFPTNSPGNYQTEWIFVNNLIKINEINKQQSEIQYKDGSKIITHISAHILNKQLTRTYALMHMVNMDKGADHH